MWIYVKSDVCKNIKSLVSIKYNFVLKFFNINILKLNLWGNETYII